MGRFLSGMAVGAAGNIAAPFPTVVPNIKCNYNNTPTKSTVLPHPANDGKSIEITAGAINILSTTNAVLYTLTALNINASALAINTWFVDTVNGLIWVIAGNSNNPGYGWLASFNYTTGVKTTVGGGFTGPVNTFDAPGVYNTTYMERAAIGSGDLTVWNGSWNFSVSTATGLITVAESRLLFSGIAPASGQRLYGTADKTLFVQIQSVTISSSNMAVQNVTSLTIFRNGRVATASFDCSSVGGMGGNDGALPITVRLLGSNVVLTTTITGGASYLYGAQIYDRISFDAWLQRIATSLGMP